MDNNQSRKIFSQLATKYDTEERAKVAKIIADAIQKKITDGENKNALDYSCGTGLVGLNLVNYFKSILFVDISPNMIKQVNRKIITNNIKNASTLCKDFCIKTPPLKVDYILISQVLLHIKDTTLILSKLLNLIQKDGHLIIVDFNKENNINSDIIHNGFEQSELITLIKQVGFSSAKSETFYHGEKIFMNQDASLFILDAIK